jgi:hypothetical protein
MYEPYVLITNEVTYVQIHCLHDLHRLMAEKEAALVQRRCYEETVTGY